MFVDDTDYYLGLRWNSDLSPRISKGTIFVAVTCIITNFCFIATKFVAADLQLPSSLSPPTGDQDVPDDCESCKLLVKSFDEGMDRTMRGKHEGGDTYWEEKNLKSYTDSEVRLVEIQEELCTELSKGKAECLKIAEDAESDIEEWWFKHKNKNVRLHDYLCINKLKKCCPENTFGSNCQKCPSDCNKRGHCDGSGTRSGTGECVCQTGYIGQECNECDEDYYKMREDSDEKFACLLCHKACKGGCDGPTSANCTECLSGYSRDPNTNLCIDINECALGPHGMSIETDRLCPDGTYCVNTDGHYKCSECHRVCSTCLEYGRDKCITCAPDHEMDSEHNCVHFSELSMSSDELPNVFRHRPTFHLTSSFAAIFLLLVFKILRRMYENIIDGQQFYHNIVGRREFLMLIGYIVVSFIQSRWFKYALRESKDHADRGDLNSNSESIRRSMAEL